MAPRVVTCWTAGRVTTFCVRFKGIIVAIRGTDGCRLQACLELPLDHFLERSSPCRHETSLMAPREERVKSLTTTAQAAKVQVASTWIRSESVLTVRANTWSDRHVVVRRLRSLTEARHV